MEDCLQNTNWKYHVFLSFRGEDTRLGFTDHLYATLVRKGIITFRDDEELPRGEVVSKKLIRAIEESLSAIVIISINYASSTWCLDELVKILQCKHLLGQEVFPIFYGVSPSDVRHQRGSFGEAFRRSHEKFTESNEQVQHWRNALTQVANLSGWDSRDRHETELIEEVVAELWKKLECKLPTYSDGLVGINTRLEELYTPLKLGLTMDVCFIGIWGVTGIGKTTLATALFKKIRSQFDVSCFLANVREVSEEKSQGLLQLQKKILSHLNIKGMEIETLSDGKDNLRNLLSQKKVLLVLDDVNSKRQLENLAGNKAWFGRGSRIIVTTRDKHPLISHPVLFDIYESEVLNKSDSLQLFCEKAFKEGVPKEGYLELSESMVEYARGLPLTLELWGSNLCERSISDWEDALIKIKQAAHDDILEKLRISYDMLEDEHKTMFLDIACFFKGWYKHKVIQILDDCGFNATHGINVLIEKSFVTFDGRVIWMHDTMEEMGKAIVYQESPNDPGRRSRLWSPEDIDHVMRKNKGTEVVQGIVLKSSPSVPYEAYWDPEVFTKMCNVRLLIVQCDLHLSLGLKCLSSSLKVLLWWGYPLNTLPLGIRLDELVHLQMINSKVKQLWYGAQYFRKLKVIDLSNSKDLCETPNISEVPNLEELCLKDCTKLSEVDQSVIQHKKLMRLILMGCVNLKSFPSKLDMPSLKMFSLSDCSNVERLPGFGKNMILVSVLNLMNCKNLSCLPDSISNLKSLRVLNISGCSEIYKLPDSINQNKALEELDLSRTAIREFGPSLLQLGNLKRLYLSECSGSPSNSRWDLHLPFRKKLRFFPSQTGLILPPLFLGLSSLTVLDLSYCNLTDNSIPRGITFLLSLNRLILSGNNFIHMPTHYITHLSNLCYLDLEDCPQLQSLPSLPPHICLYITDSDAKRANVLDSEKIWKLFESNDKELFQSSASQFQKLDFPYPVYMEVPAGFDNQKFYPLGSSYVSKLDSIASVTVDIPDDCRSSDWWGVAIFIALEAQVQQHSEETGEGFLARHMRLCWNFDTLGPDDVPSLSLLAGSTANNDMYLFTMVVSGDFIFIQRHLRGDQKFMRKHFSKHRRPEFREKSSLHFELRARGCKIRKGRCHMLHKKDYLEELQKVHNVEVPSYSDHSGGVSKSTSEEFKGEDDLALDEQNIVKARENFFSGKMFDNIRRGLGFSVLALMLMVVAGSSIFNSPVQSLDFKPRATTIETMTKPLKSNWLSSPDIVVKVNTPQLQRNLNRNVKQRLSFPIYKPPRRLSFSQSHFCSYLI